MPSVRLAVLTALLSAATVAGAAEQCYFPGTEGARLSYLSRTGADGTIKLHWELLCRSVVPLAEGGERLTFQIRAGRAADPAGWQRQERYVRNESGLFAVGIDQDAYGPTPVMVPESELEAGDAMWHFRGERQLPVSFRILGLMPTADRTALTEAHYHVLGVEPVETAAGRFDEALVVTAVARLKLDLPNGLEWLITRARQWYVPGLGLVKERLRLVDVPALGELTTELTSYAGTEPIDRERLALLAGPAG